MHIDATRAILEITGADRERFLQGLITQDVTLTRPDRGLFAAMLSPQGKIIHDFFLIPHGEALLLDTPASQSATLLKRLTMYKLRAQVQLRDASADWQVAYRTRAEHAAIGHISHKPHKLLLTDPRAAELGERLYLMPGAEPKATVSLEDYHIHRIRLGIPDSEYDLDGDVAIDAGYDALGGISFTKGCYVGQEVTARMHYKNINRRGFYIVEAPTGLPAAGAAVKADGITLGTLRGHRDRYGLAMLKFEEAEQALATAQAILVDNCTVRLHAPAWLQPKLAQFRAARENQ